MTGAKLVMIEKGAVAKADKSARAAAPFFYLVLCQSI